MKRQKHGEKQAHFCKWYQQQGESSVWAAVEVALLIFAMEYKVGKMQENAV